MYSIPTLTMWWFLIEDVFSWMGFSSSIAVLASSYTKVAIFHILLEGIGEAFMALLDISGHATYGTVIDILEGLLSTVAVCIAVLFVDETSLASVALIYLFGSFLSLTFAFTFALSKGWLDMFLDGIFKNIAMKVRDILSCQFFICHCFYSQTIDRRIHQQFKIYFIVRFL